MGNCFGSQKEDHPRPKKAQAQISEEDKAAAQLMVTRDDIKKYHKRLETAIQHTKDAIKDCLRSKQKPKAVLALRKQKFLEKNLETSQAQLFQLEQMLSNIEQAKIQKTVFEALRQGTDYLQKINQQLSLDDVEKLMEDTKEAYEYQQQVSDALTREGVVVNEDDLMDQLEQLDAEEALDVELPAVPSQPLPETKVTQKKQEEKKQVVLTT